MSVILILVHVKALEEFNAAPSAISLAKPRHGGRAREEAVTRSVKARLALWNTGQFQRVCEKVSNERRPVKASNYIPSRNESKELQIRCQTGGHRSCPRLVRGWAPVESPRPIRKLSQGEAAFTGGFSPEQGSHSAARALRSNRQSENERCDDEEGFGGGHSGLRQDHIRSHNVCSRHAISEDLVAALRIFSEKARNGPLPEALQQHTCAGSLVPLN